MITLAEFHRPAGGEEIQSNMTDLLWVMSPTLAAERVAAGLAARRTEKRFRLYGRIAIGIALAFLVTLFASIFSKGIPGFFQHYVTLEVTLAWREAGSGRRPVGAVAL